MNKEKIIVAALAVLLAGSAQANLNLVQNGSFENPVITDTTPGGGYNTGPITGWNQDSGISGVWNPSTYPLASLTAADGVQIGYLNSQNNTAQISQDLGAVQANTTYSLSIEVAGRLDGSNPGTAYTVSLFVGNIMIASVTPVTPITSSWTTLTASGYSGELTGDVTIVIADASNSSTQLDVDNVIVEATAVPEASSWIAGALLLLPFGASAIRINRKNKTA